MRLAILTTAALLVTVSTVEAGILTPVKDETAKVECSDCHMAYPPILLPQASWEKIFANLSDHYGDDASLDDATTKHLLDYYVQNSNDVSRAKYEKIYEETKQQKIKEGKNPRTIRPPGKLRTAIKWASNGTPERIQDVPRFRKKHSFGGQCGDVIKAVMQRAKITSWAMCSDCHAGMPINGSSGVRFQFMEKMTDAEKQAALSDKERKCLDD